MALSDPHVKQIFAEAEESLKMPVYTLDTAEKLASTAYVQVCMLIAGVISARRLIDKGIKTDFVAGHSIGSFSAAVISGVLSFSQALPLVYTRGLLMQQAYPHGYGMAALVGLSELRVQQYINEHNKTHAAIYLANVNTADQQVIAGEIESIKIFIDSLQTHGIRKAQILNMSVPSHCLLMNSVSQALREKLSALDLKEPTIPYASNHSGRLLKTAEAIREDLWISVSRTVRWYDAMGLLYELGSGIFIEMEPSGVLSKITESCFPDAKVISMQEAHIDSVSWLWNSFQAGN